MLICSIDGCGKKVKSRGLCSAHAERLRLHGDPLGSGASPKRADRRSAETRDCKVCGTPFRPLKDRLATSFFCSRTCGQVGTRWAVENTADDFEKYFKKGPLCWEWGGSLTDSGYGEFHIGGERIRAHRYSYERYVGPLRPDALVCHRCDNPKCVNPSHLFPGSHQDNSDDMVSKGRGNSGPPMHSEMHPLSKITTEIARSIRADPRSHAAIARQYGVSSSLVGGIKRGTHWKYA